MTPHEALEELKSMTVCRCDEAYTGRGLHDPDCQCDYADAVKIVADYVSTLEARTYALELPEVKALIEATSNVLYYGIVLGDLKYKKALAAALDSIVELQKGDA